MRSSSSRAVRRLEAGARVGGKYRLLALIATGGMGEVWRARNEATHAEVALKVTRRTDPDMDARFRTEAKLGSMVGHRSIVRIFDLVEDDPDTLVLVMELLRGESLAMHVRTVGKLTNAQAVAVAIPVLSALSHAHALGIAHRDVTPSNIVLAVEPDGEVIPKLIDFGIAKLPGSGPRTTAGHALGTPAYMAPEHIRGQTLDGRADLFSLAVVLYEAITGVCPFESSTASASLAMVLETHVDPDPLIEPRVWLELKRALAKQVYERHRDAAAMAEALRRAVGQSDAELAALLRRQPPVLAPIAAVSPDAVTVSEPPLEAPEPDEPAPNAVSGAVALSTTSRRPRQKPGAARVRVAVGGALLVLAGATIGVAIHRAAIDTPHPHPAAAPPASPAEATAAAARPIATPPPADSVRPAALAEAPAVPQAAAPPPAPAPPATSSSSAKPPHAAAPAPRKRTGIGESPGF